MRGRGGGGDGGGFGYRGGMRGGRGDFHQRDRFNNNNHFNRPNDDPRGGGSGDGQLKVPSLFDIGPPQSRPFDRDHNRGGGRGRMPYPRGGGFGRDSSHDDRDRPLGGKGNAGEGPPPLLDFPNEKSDRGTPNASNSSLPSLLSVKLDGSGKE